MPTLDHDPAAEELAALAGENLYHVFLRLCAAIERRYDMDRGWNPGGKAWTYEYKYRRGGKTLCCLYFRENCLGFMVIFGKDEREKFQAERSRYSESVLKTYHEAATYRDGKWMMFFPVDETPFSDYLQLLNIKRKPNKR